MRRDTLPFRWIPVVLFAALFALSGCVSQGEQTALPETVIDIYRLARDPHTKEGLIVPEKYILPAGEDAVRFAVGAVTGEAISSGHISAFPDNIGEVSVTATDGEALVYFGGAYLKMTGIDKTAADYCLTLTLCSLEGIDSVSICVDTEIIASGLTPSDAVLVDAETNPGERQLRLFYPSQGDSFLASEYHTLTIDRDMPLYGYVLEELFRGPANPELSLIFPEGTELIDISTSDSLCTVNLSGEFYENRPEEILQSRLVIYSIVNSLTSLSDIEAVKITVDGKTMMGYTNIPISKPLYHNEAIIAPNAMDRDEYEVGLYMRVADTGALAAIPRIVRIEDSLEMEWGALKALLEDEGEPGFESLFSAQSDSGITVTTQSGISTVHLPGEFFASRDEKDLPPTMRAIALTILDLHTTDRVRFETNYDISGIRDLKLEYTRSEAVLDGIAE